MKSLVLVALLNGLIAREGGTVATATVASPSGAEAPKPVVVAIVVDQLASWVLRERLDALPAEGGFARLRRPFTRFHDELVRMIREMP